PGVWRGARVGAAIGGGGGWIVHRPGSPGPGCRERGSATERVVRRPPAVRPAGPATLVAAQLAAGASAAVGRPVRAAGRPHRDRIEILVARWQARPLTASVPPR